MARFQLFANPENEGLLLDVQSDLIDVVQTRVVIPLLPAEHVPPAVPRLHPMFDVGDQRYVMATHLIATVPSTLLLEPRGDLSQHHDAVTAALDMLFQGF